MLINPVLGKLRAALEELASLAEALDTAIHSGLPDPAADECTLSQYCNLKWWYVAFFEASGTFGETRRLDEWDDAFESVRQVSGMPVPPAAGDIVPGPTLGEVCLRHPALALTRATRHVLADGMVVVGVMVEVGLADHHFPDVPYAAPARRSDAARPNSLVERTGKIDNLRITEGTEL